jgi:hypothetical protein
MKTTSIIFTLLAGIILLTGCTLLTVHPVTTDTVVIWDITDSMAVMPEADEIISRFGLENNIWNGGTFRLRNVTDVSINKTYEASLETENEWLSNKFQRKEKIKAFRLKIEQAINEATGEKIGKDYSSLYLPIAKELNSLSKSKTDNRHMLIYSDLMDNTDELSFYDSNTLQLLMTKPDSIAKYFDSQLRLENLDGIKIYLVFQPKDMKADEVYRTVSGFYKSLFEGKGATVEVTANIN